MFSLIPKPRRGPSRAMQFCKETHAICLTAPGLIAMVLPTPSTPQKLRPCMKHHVSSRRRLLNDHAARAREGLLFLARGGQHLEDLTHYDGGSHGCAIPGRTHPRDRAPFFHRHDTNGSCTQFPTPCDNRLGRQKCANSWLMRRSKMPPRLLGARYPLQIRLQYRVALLTRQQWVKFL